jgi:hypothetical protein
MEREEMASNTHSNQNRYIIGPVHDSLWFIFSPLISLGLGFVLMLKIFAWEPQFIGPEQHRLLFYLGIAFTEGHLLATFARTHGNRAIYRQFPLRFTIVPVVLVGGIYFSYWIAAFALFVSVFWDIYHSCLQTFGLGRIYDAKAGNDPLEARRLDMAFNIVLYLGPLAAGAVFVPHLVNAIKGFARLPDNHSLLVALFTAMPEKVGAYAEGVRLVVLAVAVVVGLGFVFEYARLRRRGYRPPWQKVALFASTGICSLIAWGFNPLGVAWAVMNIFHAVQYFALVWMTEGGHLRSRLGLSERRGIPTLALVAFLGIFLWSGLFLDQLDTPATDAFILSCALLHFWYDSFVWSVRKNQHLVVSGG